MFSNKVQAIILAAGKFSQRKRLAVFEIFQRPARRDAAEHDLIETQPLDRLPDDYRPDPDA